MREDSPLEVVGKIASKEYEYLVTNIPGIRVELMEAWEMGGVELVNFVLGLRGRKPMNSPDTQSSVKYTAEYVLPEGEYETVRLYDRHRKEWWDYQKRTQTIEVRILQPWEIEDLEPVF